MSGGGTTAQEDRIQRPSSREPVSGRENFSSGKGWSPSEKGKRREASGMQATRKG